MDEGYTSENVSEDEEVEHIVKDPVNVTIFWCMFVKSFTYMTLKVMQYKQSIFIYQNFEFSY